MWKDDDFGIVHEGSLIDFSGAVHKCRLLTVEVESVIFGLFEVLSIFTYAYFWRRYAVRG